MGRDEEWPLLAVEGRAVEHLPTLYAGALRNLLETNTVTDSEGTRFVRAGGAYQDPWTRDAALNTWFAAALLEPEVARDTLLNVTQLGPDGRRVVAQDEQWWDQIVWVLGAREYVLVTGDRDFLLEAYDIGTASLEILRAERFDDRYGLFRGGALMQDGISGYPLPPYDPSVESSFVLDHPLARDVLCLSTNALYVKAIRALAELAEALGETAAAGVLDAEADLLTAAIDERFWIAELERYGYLLHGSGELDGTLDRHHEAAGDALVALSRVARAAGVADTAGVERARRVVARTPRGAYGIVNVWPHFDGIFDDEHPGRHNVLCWPMVQGLHAYAASRLGLVEVFDAGLRDLERLFTGSGGAFFETYDAFTGAVDGGWQVAGGLGADRPVYGRHWDSQPDQTWSATAFLYDLHSGLLGLTPGADGLRLVPCVPGRFDTIRLQGLRYRDARLDIVVRGSGTVVGSATLDGRPVGPDGVLVPAELSGAHTLEVDLRERRPAATPGP